MNQTMTGRNAQPVASATPGPSSSVLEQQQRQRQYAQVEQWCQHHIHRGSDFLYDGPDVFASTLRQKSQELVDYPVDSLESFFRNLHTEYVKIAAYRLKNDIHRYLDGYREGQSLSTMARKANVPPYLLCRHMVQRIANLTLRKQGDETYNQKDPKKRLTLAMRDPIGVLGDHAIIRPEFGATEEAKITTQTTRLSREVAEALALDPLTGPEQDRRRHFVGIEYEVVLEQQLNVLGIPFEAEEQLREKGTAKTPDVLLLVPVAFQVGSEWKIVNWIDSKALYGDVKNHQTSVLPQASSYLHRYGPGMILYWFGHAPLALLEAGSYKNDNLLICSRDLPKCFMWPTGEIENEQPS